MEPAKLRSLCFSIRRSFSVKVKTTINEEVDKLLENKIIKHRKHPGVVKPRSVILPKWVIQSIKQVLQEESTIPTKNLCTDGKLLAQHLLGRHVPVEEDELNMKVDKVQQMLGVKLKRDDLDPDLKHKAKLLLKQNVYHWQPIQYDRYKSLSYIFARAAQNYAVLYRIMNEILTNDQNFQPKSLFDFGSGIGTVLWVASQLWSKSLREYICVDASRHMNELSEELCQQADPKIKNVFYRQFLPALPKPTADIVISAYSLLELPSAKTRLDTLKKLWDKTESYLVIVEQGTNAGFKIINEARDFLLYCTKDKWSENESQAASVFSPCPHDLSCPRFATDDTPCNFEVSYYTLPFVNTAKHQTERYSYVILKKGEQKEDNRQWPRIVRPVLNRSNHTICRMCTASGQMQEVIFTKAKHGRNIYACARKSAWGDRLPLRVENVPSSPTDENMVQQEENDATPS